MLYIEHRLRPSALFFGLLASTASLGHSTEDAAIKQRTPGSSKIAQMMLRFFVQRLRLMSVAMFIRCGADVICGEVAWASVRV